MGDSSKSHELTEELRAMRPPPNEEGYRPGIGRGAQLPTAKERALKPRLSLVDIKIEGKVMPYDAQIYSMVVRAGMKGGVAETFKKAAELTAQITSDELPYHEVMASLRKQAGMSPIPSPLGSLPQSNVRAVHDDSYEEDEFPEDGPIELEQLSPVVASATDLKRAVEGVKAPESSTQVENPVTPVATVTKGAAQEMAKAVDAETVKEVAEEVQAVTPVPAIDILTKMSEEELERKYAEAMAKLQTKKTAAPTEVPAADTVLEPGRNVFMEQLEKMIAQGQSEEAEAGSKAQIDMQEFAKNLVMGLAAPSLLQPAGASTAPQVEKAVEEEIPAPRVKVAFSGPFGTIRTRYHNVDHTGDFLVLIFDKRCEDVDVYEPPMLNDSILRVEVDSGAHKAGFYCRSLGMNLDLDSRGLYLVVLIVLPAEDSQVQLLEAERSGAFDEEQETINRLR